MNYWHFAYKYVKYKNLWNLQNLYKTNLTVCTKYFKAISMFLFFCATFIPQSEETSRAQKNRLNHLKIHLHNAFTQIYSSSRRTALLPPTILSQNYI